MEFTVNFGIFLESIWMTQFNMKFLLTNDCKISCYCEVFGDPVDVFLICYAVGPGNVIKNDNESL